MHPKPTTNPNYRPKPATPRKVRGGIKLASSTGSFPESWAAQRWMRLVESAAAGEPLVAGLGYATAGQTRRFSIDPGRAHATIQGTQYTPYETSLTVRPFTHDQVEALVSAMADQAVHAAKLLTGELPPSIEDVLGPLNLRLFPAEPSEILPRCTCRDARGPALDVHVSATSLHPPSGQATPQPAPQPTPQPASPPGPIWCKHACCLAFLVAERLANDPFVMFTLRGLPKDDLLERLRQRRAVAGASRSGALVYQPAVPGASDTTSLPLDQCLAHFWEPGPGLDRIEAPIEPPAVTHPLLRRLGPSPLGGAGRFPLVGLLATCYDVISQHALRSNPDKP